MDELLIVDELMTQEELAAHEQTIQRGKQTFVEVGKALREIRDRKGYRHTHGTFADYVTTRWGFSVSTGYNLIGASEVVENVQALGRSVEYAKAVAISKLAEPEQQAFVEKTDIDALTSRAVEKAVAEWKRKTEQAERERDEVMGQAKSLSESNAKTREQYEALKKLKTPEPVVVEKVVEVDSAESRRKLEEAQRIVEQERETNEILRRGLRERTDERDALKMQTADYDTEGMRLKREHLKMEAEISVLQLRVAIKDFLRTNAISSLASASIAMMDETEKRKLAESLVALDAFVSQIREAIRSELVAI